MPPAVRTRLRTLRRCVASLAGLAVLTSLTACTVAPVASPEAAAEPAATAAEPRATPPGPAARAAAEAGASLDRGDRDGAIRIAAEAIAALLARTDADLSREDQLALRDLSFTAYRIDPRSGLAGFERLAALHDATRVPDDLERLEAHWGIAECSKVLGDLPRGLREAEAVLPGFERALPPGDERLQSIRAAVATHLRVAGRLEEARELQERALAEYELVAAPDDLHLQNARLMLAATLHELGEAARVRELSLQALAALERTLPADDPRIDVARLNLANGLRELGELDAAQALEERAADHFQRIYPEDHPDVAWALQNLGATCWRRGDLERARRIGERVLALRERTLGEDHPDRIAARFNLALTLLSQRDVAGARPLLEQALSGWERSLPDDHPDVQRARDALASVYCNLGQPEIALPLAERAVAVHERTGHPHLVHAQATLGVALGQLGRHEAALTVQASVLAEFERRGLEDSPVGIGARHNLALTARRLRDHPRARALQEAVLAALERTNVPEDREVLLARTNLIPTLAAMGDDQAVDRQVEDLAAGLSAQMAAAAQLAPREAIERASAVEFEIEVLLAFSQRRPREAFELVELIRATGAAERLGPDPSPRARELRARLRVLHGELNDLVVGAGPRDPLRLAEIARARDDAETQLRAEVRTAPATRIEADALARALPTGACAVSLRRSIGLFSAREELEAREHLTAFVLPAGGTVRRIELGELAPIRAAVERWRMDIGQPVDARGLGGAVERTEARDDVSAGDELCRLVLDPVAAALGPAREVFVCLDDALHLVPLEALPCGGRLAGERWSIHVESSFARLLATAARRDDHPVRLVACGGIDYDAEPEVSAAPAGDALTPPVEVETRDATRGRIALARWEPLSATLEEARAVVALAAGEPAIETVLLSGSAAAKDALCRAVEGATLIHLATHGWFAPDSVRSVADPIEPGRLWRPMSLEDAARGFAPQTLCGLALSGANRGADALGRVPGVITAEEIAGLDLSACQLAVLSACETGTGVVRAGLGIHSLQAALRAAGARATITSLWRVGDDATRELFGEFYGRAWAQRVPAARALWEAKLALRARGRPVRDWAGWVYSGDPEVTLR